MSRCSLIDRIDLRKYRQTMTILGFIDNKPHLYKKCDNIGNLINKVISKVCSENFLKCNDTLLSKKELKDYLLHVTQEDLFRLTTNKTVKFHAFANNMVDKLKNESDNYSYLNCDIINNSEGVIQDIRRLLAILQKEDILKILPRKILPRNNDTVDILTSEKAFYSNFIGGILDKDVFLKEVLKFNFTKYSEVSSNKYISTINSFLEITKKYLEDLPLSTDYLVNHKIFKLLYIANKVSGIQQEAKNISEKDSIIYDLLLATDGHSFSHFRTCVDKYFTMDKDNWVNDIILINQFIVPLCRVILLLAIICDPSQVILNKITANNITKSTPSSAYNADFKEFISNLKPIEFNDNIGHIFSIKSKFDNFFGTSSLVKYWDTVLSELNTELISSIQTPIPKYLLDDSTQFSAESELELELHKEQVKLDHEIMLQKHNELCSLINLKISSLSVMKRVLFATSKLALHSRNTPTNCGKRINNIDTNLKSYYENIPFKSYTFNNERNVNSRIWSLVPQIERIYKCFESMYKNNIYEKELCSKDSKEVREIDKFILIKTIPQLRNLCIKMTEHISDAEMINLLNDFNKMSLIKASLIKNEPDTTKKEPSDRTAKSRLKDYFNKISAKKD